MTCEYFDSNHDDALYNLARRYPGNIEALALRMQRSATVLRKQLSPGVQTHHLSADDFCRVIELCLEAGVKNPFQPLYAMNFRLGHVAIQLPENGPEGSELFQQVLDMLRHEGDLAQCIQDAISENGDGGTKITKREMANIDANIERCISALVKVREDVRRRHKRDSE